MVNYVEHRYGPQNLHALSLMPGGIFTSLQKHISREIKVGLCSNSTIMDFNKSPEQGAATTVFAAANKEWEGRGGKYLADCAEASSSITPGPGCDVCRSTTSDWAGL